MYLSTLFTAISAVAAASARPNTKPYAVYNTPSYTAPNSTIVDLGYEIYQGVSNKTTHLNIFKGIRYAAPPTGSLRWQAPHLPTLNRTDVLPASEWGASCPQNTNNGGYGSSLIPSSEDCLFLNVWAPTHAKDLPVLVWIHGGGYGAGDAAVDMSSLIGANGNGFIGVSVQYRLGAFGFLSSKEVYENGVVNAGLLDQQLAFRWIQEYIHLFGGDPDRVTISGQSAGAGSVMLHGISYGGSLGTELFANSVSVSAYLPQQHGYSDPVPTKYYLAFATAAGCFPDGELNGEDTFQCLISQDTEALQNASALVSSSGPRGSWAFNPVTDGVFIQATPTQALSKGKINGINHLAGNNAEEGAFFTPFNITTEEIFIDWVKTIYPLFTEDDISNLLKTYPTLDTTESLPLFATSGDHGLTALDVSQVGSGQQQRANNIYAEAVFVCPSYWLAETYNQDGKKGYKYQYSVPNSAHGFDIPAYLGPPTPNLGTDFILAFQRIWGSFVINSDPSIPSDIANGNGASTPVNDLEDWPPFTGDVRKMANLNQTGGVEFTIPYDMLGFPGVNVTQYSDPGLQNDLRLVDADAWEGGRGERCEFWKSVAARVPA